MNHFRSFSFLALLLVCSLYSYWQTTKDFEWIIPYMEDRTPAAIRESQDYKALLNKPLRVFKREAMVDSIQLKEENEKFFVSIGHYATVGAKGPNFLCLDFPFVKLKWRAEGMAISGRQPKLLVVAPCKNKATTTEYLNDIEIPFNELYRMPAQDIQFTHQQNNFTSEVHLKNMNGEWPKTWQLESIQFLTDKNNIDVDSSHKITDDEILKKRGMPLLVHLETESRQ